MDYFSRSRRLTRTFLSGIGKAPVIYASAFLVAVGEGSLNLGTVFFMRDSFGAPPSLIGWLMAFTTLVYILGCLLLRPLLDRVRPRFLLILATAGMALSILLLYWLRSVPTTFLFYGLSKLSTSLFWPPVMGWLSQSIEGPELNRTMSRFNISWSTGLVASSALAGYLSQRSPALPLLAAAAVFVLALLLLAWAAAALPRIRADLHRERQRAEPAAADRSTALRFPAWIALFTSYVVGGVIATVFPLFAQDSLTMTKSLVGTLLSVRTFARSAGFLLLGRLTFWHFRARYVPLNHLYLVGLLVLMMVARSPGAYAVIFPLLGLSTALSYSISLFHGVSGASRRAARMAIHESLLTGGYIVGASAGGLLYQELSMTAVLLFCALCVAAGIAAQSLLVMRRLWHPGASEPARF